jgi:phenylacetate-CoA ligase
MSDIVRLHASSGTTGKPIVVAYTKEDIAVWEKVDDAQLRGLRLARRRHHPERLRLRPVHRRAGRALRRRGAGRHRDSHLRRQHRAPVDGDEGFWRHGHLLHAQLFPAPHRSGARTGWESTKELPLRAGVFGAEPWTESMRRRIEAESGIKAYDIYGLSEIIGPGVAMECECQAGPHIFEDHFLSRDH